MNASERTANTARRRLIEPRQKAILAARTASDGKAENVVILDVHETSSVTDFYVIFTGLSTTHLRALAKKLEEKMREADAKPSGVDGAKAASWVVYDYGSVVIHGMLEDTRTHYDLERLWGDAPRIQWADPA